MYLEVLRYFGNLLFNDINFEVYVFFKLFSEYLVCKHVINIFDLLYLKKIHNLPLENTCLYVIRNYLSGINLITNTI